MGEHAGPQPAQDEPRDLRVGGAAVAEDLALALLQAGHGAGDAVGGPRQLVEREARPQQGAALVVVLGGEDLGEPAPRAPGPPGGQVVLQHAHQPARERVDEVLPPGQWCASEEMLIFMARAMARELGGARPSRATSCAIIQAIWLVQSQRSVILTWPEQQPGAAPRGPVHRGGDRAPAAPRVDGRGVMRAGGPGVGPSRTIDRPGPAPARRWSIDRSRRCATSA